MKKAERNLNFEKWKGLKLLLKRKNQNIKREQKHKKEHLKHPYNTILPQ